MHDQVQYEDVEGQRRTASVSRWVSRRYPPSHAYLVWYDRLDPSHVTANGPLYLLGFAMVLVALLIGLFIMAAQINAA